MTATNGYLTGGNINFGQLASLPSPISEYRGCLPFVSQPACIRLLFLFRRKKLVKGKCTCSICLPIEISRIFGLIVSNPYLRQMKLRIACVEKSVGVFQNCGVCWQVFPRAARTNAEKAISFVRERLLFRLKLDKPRTLTRN